MKIPARHKNSSRNVTETLITFSFFLLLSRKDNFASLRKCQTVPSTMEFHSSYCHLKMPHSSADLETWLWESSCFVHSAMKNASPDTQEHSDLNSCPNFLPNSDESGLEIDFDSSSETSFQTAPEY